MAVTSSPHTFPPPCPVTAGGDNGCAAVARWGTSSCSLRLPPVAVTVAGAGEGCRPRAHGSLFARGPAGRARWPGAGRAVMKQQQMWGSLAGDFAGEVGATLKLSPLREGGVSPFLPRGVSLSPRTGWPLSGEVRRRHRAGCWGASPAGPRLLSPLCFVWGGRLARGLREGRRGGSPLSDL